MATPNYVLLDRVELNADTASVSFSNIPQTGYTDLVVKYTARYTSNVDGSTYIRFNSDTSSNYKYKLLYGDPGASAAGSAGSSSATSSLGGSVDFSTMTANTFASNEIYIPNYNGSSQKSFSVDGVSETNGSQSYLSLIAGLWTGTSSITSMNIFPASGSFVSGSTFSLYGIAAYGTTPAIAPKADGGNVIATDGTYWYHAFLSSGTFTPQVALSADVLVVAGGGGGASGGGGAGGVFYATGSSLSSTGYTCTVGAGGNGGSGGNVSGYFTATSGANSTFGSLTAAVGGGYGAMIGNNGQTAGANGGSGGAGGAYSSSTTTGGSSTQTGTGGTGYGYAGGGNGGYLGSPYPGGGGGGAGSIGANATSNSAAGNGGSGLNTWSTWLSATALGVSGYIAGGGGGSTYNTGGTAGTASAGGGAGSATGYGTAGTANTGGGGGAGLGGGVGTNYTGGNGGSGIVIIRYLVA